MRARDAELSCGLKTEGGGVEVVVVVVGEGWEGRGEEEEGRGVGVCLCGIRQGLACMTRATRKFPVW